MDQAHRLQAVIARIDQMLSMQVNKVLVHPRFQRLEASWRQLYGLAIKVTGSHQVKLRVFNASWDALRKDTNIASDFDTSYLFKQVYSNEFGMPGGEPFGLLIGDYSITQQAKDLAVVRVIGEIAAASFAPFIIGVKPEFFDLHDFSQLQVPINLPRTFLQKDYQAWASLQKNSDMRFVGLVLPRVLVRTPYTQRHNKFCFYLENKAAQANYLWGNPCYTFAEVAINTFQESGWFAGIQGIKHNMESGAIVKNLLRDTFATYDEAPLQKIATNVYVSEEYEKQLSELGFIVLCECRYTSYNTFYSCPSLHEPSLANDSMNTINSPLSAMLNYVMCISRFAHYIKVIARRKLGSLTNSKACEVLLQQWLLQYTADGADMSSELMAKHPLRSASVEVKEHEQAPGSYYVIIYLQPHYQFNVLHGSIRLSTELDYA